MKIRFSLFKESIQLMAGSANRLILARIFNACEIYGLMFKFSDLTVRKRLQIYN